MRKPKTGPLVVFFLLTFPVFLLGCKVMYLYNASDESSLGAFVSAVNGCFLAMLKEPFVYDFKNTYLGGVVADIALWLIWMGVFGTPRNFRSGEEHGSARWGTRHDIKPFIDKNFYNNLLLTSSEWLSMSPRMFVDQGHDFNRNKNVLVIGSAGSGKTRFVAKPLLMQCHDFTGKTQAKQTAKDLAEKTQAKQTAKDLAEKTQAKQTAKDLTGKTQAKQTTKKKKKGFFGKYLDSIIQSRQQVCGVNKKSFVVTTPKGDLVRETGSMFERAGYKIRVFNLIEPQEGCSYNFFNYIYDDKDVLKLVTNIIKNTSPDSSTSADPFWEKSEIAFLEAIFSYLHYFANEDDQNMGGVMDLYAAASVKEDNEEFVSALDVLFQDLEEDENHKDCFALAQYKIFKKGAGKTAKSILISVGVRLSAFNIPRVKALMDHDELHLDKIGQEPTVLYVVTSDTDSSLNFLSAIMYQQLFDVLIREADMNDNGMLNYHVQCVLDEFANMGLIPDFDKLISTMRSRQISVVIILQSLAQIKKLYEKSWEIITGCCDSILFLGGNEQSTLEYLSKRIDQETVDVKNDSVSKAASGGYSFSRQTQGRSLMTAGEIGELNRKYCLYILSGVPPFKSRKYDIMAHPNYKYLSDSDKSLIFSFPKYRKEQKSQNKNVRLQDEKTGKENDYEINDEKT